MRLSWIGAIGLITFSTVPVGAAEECPLPIAVPSASAPNLAALITKARLAFSPKSEYETSGAYVTRLTLAARSLPNGPVAIAWPAEDLTKFDADTGQVSVSPYAIDGNCLIFDAVLPDVVKSVVFGNPVRTIDGTPIYGTSYCTTRSLVRMVGKPYSAANAYGAKALVDVTHESDIGFYFGYGDIGQKLLPNHLTSDPANPAFEFHATIDEAKSLKTNAELIFLVSPRFPFFARGEYYAEPKIDDPHELYLNESLLVVQLHCIAIADRLTGKVFASRPATPQVLTTR